MKDRAPPTLPNLSQQDPNYASDAELLAAAGIVVLCKNEHEITL